MEIAMATVLSIVMAIVIATTTVTCFWSRGMDPELDPDP
jgi:hypothetical protein